MNKENKVFTENLPRWKTGSCKNKINWKESIGYKIKGIHEGLEFEVQIVDYNKNHLYIKYLDKEPLKIFTGHFMDCKLTRLLGKRTSEFKIKIGQIFKDDKRDITIIDRKYMMVNGQNKKYYKYKCNKCGFECEEHYRDGKYHEELWITESNLKKGCGCSVCRSAPQIVVLNINSIVAKEETHWMIKYFQGGYEEAKLYTKNSGQKIIPVCPDCGRVKDKAINISNIYRTHSIGCSCSDGQSYPNKFCHALLTQLGIKFKTEYDPEWIKPRRYDFYFELDNKKYIIEMDGGLGHGEVVHGKSKLTIKESQEIDNYKNKLADEHNIEVIRIKAEESELEYIKNNIITKLNKLFDLSDIDWLKAEEFALSNLVKKACEIKHNNPDMSTLNIANMMKLAQKTIIKYLKKGNKLGWCEYNSKNEMIKSSKKAGKANGKPVEIFKDGIKLDYPPFESCADLERQSEKLFGIKLNNRNIGNVCNGKQKHHHGFTFKYVDKNI